MVSGGQGHPIPARLAPLFDRRRQAQAAQRASEKSALMAIEADEVGSTSVDPYTRKVGERLRAIRRQKRLSLQEVEAKSNQEFKASVLGAYERGERAISVPRLKRLSRFYSVPVDQLLPNDDGPAFTADDARRADSTV